MFNSLQQGLQYAFKGFPFRMVFPTNNINEPYFIGLELLPIFEVRDSYELTRVLSEDETMNINTNEFPAFNEGNRNPLGGNPTITLISLPGLFKLVAVKSSRNPNVAEFDRYIRHEVLPTLWNNPEIMEQINALSMENAQLRHKINLKPMIEIIDKSQYPYNEYENMKRYFQEVQPYVALGQAIVAGEYDITIDMLAKILIDNGYPTGSVKLREEMREDGFLCKYRPVYNYPIQDMVTKGYMHICNDGTRYYTYITPEGQKFFINYYMNKLKSKTPEIQ